MHNKSYAYLIHVKPKNLVFLKAYNNEFVEIIITLIDQNGRDKNVIPLQIKDKVSLTLLINK